MKKFLWSVLGVGALLVCAQVAYTATTDNQVFTVTVPQNISIVAPVPTVTKVLTVADLSSNANVAFPSQAWQVKGNTRNGVSVSFSTGTAFENSSDTTYKRDAKLTLTLGTATGPGVWTIGGTGIDTTNYAAAIPDGVATVTCSSTRTGQTALNLDVEFVTVDMAEVAEGDYVTTVTGTVTANP